MNSVYTDTEVRITIDIPDAGFIALTPLFSVTWNIGCQYNNFNMADNCRKAMSALGIGWHLPRPNVLHRAKGRHLLHH